MSKLIKCKSCNNEIASSAKYCLNCGVKNKKPLYKRPWFILIAVFLVFSAIGGEEDNSSYNNTTDYSTYNNSTTSSTYNETIQSTEQNNVVENDVYENIPTEYKSALKKAQSYNELMYMSKYGLYDQLTSEYGEKFTEEAAKYAIDNLDADWKENALKKAKSYQENMSMSPSAIYDQLVSEYGEKFTEEEAQYAIDNLE